jgi:hemerythrin superfamily protein
MGSIHHPNHYRPHDAVPAAHSENDPIQALLRDHDMIRALADAYLNSRSAEVKKQAAAQLLQAIHTHSRLEESVFYPGVRKIEPNLVAHFEEDHLNVDDMLAALEDMRLDQPRTRKTMRAMIDAVLDHIREEEEEFFPLLKLANLDLSAIGLEMQVFEANLVHMQAQFGGRGIRH